VNSPPSALPLMPTSACTATQVSHAARSSRAHSLLAAAARHRQPRSPRTRALGIGFGVVAVDAVAMLVASRTVAIDGEGMGMVRVAGRSIGSSGSVPFTGLDLNVRPLCPDFGLFGGPVCE